MTSPLRPLPRWLLVFLTLYLAFLGWLVVTRLVPEPPLELPETLELSDRPTLGRADAPVSIVVFSDFQCPHCRDFDFEVLPRLERAFVNTGKVKITYLHNPFMSEDSYTAAVATECVYQQNPMAYWPYQRAVFEAQRPIQGWATLGRLVKAAKSESLTGINFEELALCISTQKSEAAVKADKALADRLGINRVPTVFVNRRQEKSYPDLQQVVSREVHAVEVKVQER